MLKNEDSCLQLERWGRIRALMGTTWSLEDVYTLRKAIELKQVDTYWELGILHVARIKLLASEFRYDEVLQNIAKYLFERTEEWIEARVKQERYLSIEDIEMIFRDQPDMGLYYDIHKCKYKYRLIKKYPEMKGLIMDMVHA